MTYYYHMLQNFRTEPYFVKRAAAQQLATVPRVFRKDVLNVLLLQLPGASGTLLRCK